MTFISAEEGNWLPLWLKFSLIFVSTVHVLGFPLLLKLPTKIKGHIFMQNVHFHPS